MDLPILSAFQYSLALSTLQLFQPWYSERQEGETQQACQWRFSDWCFKLWCSMFSSVLLCCCFLYPLEFFSKPICNYNYCGSGIICLLRTTLFSASNFPEVQPLTCLCRNLPIGSHHKLKDFKVFHWVHLWPQETITLLPFKSYTRKDSVKLLLLSFCNKEVYWWYSSKKDCGIRRQGKRKKEMVIRGQRAKSNGNLVHLLFTC